MEAVNVKDDLKVTFVSGRRFVKVYDEVYPKLGFSNRSAAIVAAMNAQLQEWVKVELLMGGEKS